MNSLFGDSGGQTKVAPPQPWKPLQPYLTTGLSYAKNALTSQWGSPAFQGNLYAGLNPMQTEGANALAAFARGPGGNLSDMVGGLASSNAAAGSQFAPNALSIFGQASLDPTQNIINAAGQYANNPYADSLVDAATRDVNRTLNEDQLTGLNNAASASGNLNSSRAGAMEGIMRRGAADRIADTSANIRGNLFNTGLGMAQNQWNQNLSNMLSANTALGQAGGNAVDYANQGQQMGFSNADAIARAGSIFQQDQQGQLDQAYNKWQMGDTRNWDVLNRYWSVVSGTPMGGGSAYQTQGQTGIIPGLAGLGLSAYGMGLFN